jgi:hypothetical protein
MAALKTREAFARKPRKTSDNLVGSDGIVFDVDSLQVQALGRHFETAKLNRKTAKKKHRKLTR